MGTVSRQEVQSMLNTHRAQVIDRLATKHELQFLLENVRIKLHNQMVDWRQTDGVIARQTMSLTDQAVRRMTVLESRMAGIESQLQAIETLLVRYMQQPQVTYHNQPSHGVAGQTHPSVPNRGNISVSR